MKDIRFFEIFKPYKFEQVNLACLFNFMEKNKITITKNNFPTNQKEQIELENQEHLEKACYKKAKIRVTIENNIS